MKKLSDYKGEEAIDLWVDLLDLMSDIFKDKKVAELVRSGKPKIELAKGLLKLHKQDTIRVMERIDSTPVDGLNIITRLVLLISEIGEDETVRSFFGYSEQAKTADESSISAMENTEESEK